MASMASPPNYAIALAILGLLTSSGTAFAASSSAQPANPTAPSYADDMTWLTGYLTIHSLSINSYDYMFLFWFLIALVFFALSWATWTDVRITSFGARWQKWALRRRTWRKKHTLKKVEEEARKKGVPVSAVHRQPRSLPSNAQILTATALVIIILVICFVGPDYINPDLDLFHFSDSTSSPSSSSSGATKRAKLTAPINDQTMDSFIPHYNIQKSWWTSAARTGGVAFALFPLVVLLALKAPPFAIFGIRGLVQFGHDKTIRLHRYVGRLIYFVTLLHVLFWVVQVLKDKRESTGKLVFMYVWGYQKFRFAWVAFLSITVMMIFTLDCIRTRHYELFYAVHIIFTPMTIIFSALHHPQRGLWGWCAAALALWIGERLWRAFAWVYVNGVFGIKKGKSGDTRAGPASISPYTFDSRPEEKETMLGPGEIGHRQMASSRGSTVTLISSANPLKESFDGKAEQYELNALRSPVPSILPSRYSASKESLAYGDTHDDEPTPTPGEAIEVSRVKTGNNASGGSVRGIPLQIQTVSAPSPAYPSDVHSPPIPARAQSPGAGPGPQSSASARYQFQPHPTRLRALQYVYSAPPGYSLATLLPGRTIRLKLVTPGYQTWAPGQHFLVNIPSISRFTTHPFSVASVCDEQAALHVDPDSPEDGRTGRKLVQAEAGRELVLLVRAKKGWTKRLWDLVSSLQSQGHASPPGETLPEGYAPPPQGLPGVILRTLVDGPFGSAGRTRWGTYSSVLIVAGGSGVSFGLSVLEYVCLCIAGRDGRFLGGYPGGWGVGPKGAWITQRVRFVWLVREYAHIQWVVSSLRRCLQIVPTDALELNIFVSNHRPQQELVISPGSTLVNAVADKTDDASEDGHLKPPAPRFLAGSGGGSRGSPNHVSPSSSEDSLASDVSVDSIVDSYLEGPDGSELGHETHVLDYTNFDGDDDTPMPGENRLSRRIIKESKVRRALSRKRESAVRAKRELEQRVVAARASVIGMDALGHAKSPTVESGGDGEGGVVPLKDRSNRSSTYSTAPLLSSGKHNSAEISPTSVYSAFSFSTIPQSENRQQGQHPHAQSNPQTNRPTQQQENVIPPPSSFPFTSFGSSANELSSASGPSTNHHHHHHHHQQQQPNTLRFSQSSSSTLKSPSVSASMSTLAPTPLQTPGIRWASDPFSPRPPSIADSSSWFALTPTPSSGDVGTGTGTGTGMGVGVGGVAGLGGLGPGITLDRQEIRDLQIVSEWARPGKPKLGRILSDEVERAKGRVVVACCGPTSLNALMRKHITEQIDPGRVARGDMRGSIDFVAEDFEY